MIKINQPFLFIALNLFIILLFFYLPYYLFDGRLFLGGDDTRFHYAYPREVLNSLSIYSWNNISSLPLYLPNHHSIPFLYTASLLAGIINSKVHLFYFLFSLPLVLGFIFFQKLIRELLGKESVIPFIAALIYVLSPITIVSHISHFLSPVWLIALVPIVTYYFIRYIRNGSRADIVKAVIWSVFLSFAYYAIPWILGVMFPLVVSLIIYLLFIERSALRNIKKTFIFCFFIISSQMFWLFPFVMSFTYRGESDLGGNVVSKGLIDSFTPTVVATATGNIINPLLTHYHRQIAFDFNWHLSDIFINYYDRILPLSIIFVIVLFWGILRSRKLTSKDYKVFIFFLISFLISLFYFTVNIGFLKNLFLFLGNLPGFAIFRNFTDKFSLGYIFIYAVLISFCFLIIKRTSKSYILLISVSIFVIIVNLIPIKDVVNSPLWKTNSIYQTINLPQEYLHFTEQAKNVVPKSENIIVFPQTIASYSVITEDNGWNAYVGTSPFRFLTGINDLSGTLSYTESIGQSINKSLVDRDYEKLLKILKDLNVGYLMVTNNLPKEVRESYLYDKNILHFQDKRLVDAISDKEILKSSKGNYVIKKLKNKPRAVTSEDFEISFKKISPVKYEVEIKGLDGKGEMVLNETFHPGWKVYPYNRDSSKLYINPFSEKLFESTHKKQDFYGNKWTLAEESIRGRENLVASQNKDGSINTKLLIFFWPQMYLYLGIVITFVLLFVGFMYLFKVKYVK